MVLRTATMMIVAAIFLLGAGEVFSQEECAGLPLIDPGYAWPEGARVRVIISPEFTPSQNAEIKSALRGWQNAGGSGVTFDVFSQEHPISGPNTLQITKDLPESDISPARTKWGKVWPHLESAIIRVRKNYNPPPGVLGTVIGHEIGHTFGYAFNCMPEACPPGTTAMTNSTDPNNPLGTKCPTACDHAQIRERVPYEGTPPSGECKDCIVHICYWLIRWECIGPNCYWPADGGPSGDWIPILYVICYPVPGCCYEDGTVALSSSENICGDWIPGDECEFGTVCCYDNQLTEPTGIPSCSAMGLYAEDQREICESESGQSCVKNIFTAQECKSPDCEKRICWTPFTSCGELGGDYCSQTNACPSGYDDLGPSDDCAACCREGSSCGQFGGDYCSQSNSCPPGYDALEETFDCKTCCEQGPSCGQLGGDYCSQSGTCPGGTISVGVSYDCNPCCKSLPCQSTGCPRGTCGWQTDNCGTRIWCGQCQPSCGAKGGDYCSQTNSCPRGYKSLGSSYDCKTCCEKGPSCGAKGGNYCSQSGRCPSGAESLGKTYDCNPCCRQ